MEAHIKNTKNDNWAPVSEAIFQLYTYLMPRTSVGVHECRAFDADLLPTQGRDGATNFPCTATTRTATTTTGSGMLTDPVQRSCQKNFIILVTGGLASRDDFDAGSRPAPRRASPTSTR